MTISSHRIDWHDALMIVQPRMPIRWHLQCFRTLSRNKLQAGRPVISLELQRVIRRMANEKKHLGRRTHCQRAFDKTGYFGVTSNSPKIHAKKFLRYPEFGTI